MQRSLSDVEQERDVDEWEKLDALLGKAMEALTLYRHALDLSAPADTLDLLRENVDHYVEKVEAMRRKLGEQDW
ncbi:hypothetical protein G7007_07815 [Pseudomonas entomophila]|uniref:hypothetical protein n=1 Tax=Pseudomonas entomophila TaxID=312306 RepID=UPI0015E48E62|nr:hypothetical protein [Pseudomonas entomophila]MBA1192765.1 hypothetical protein [Pseudomonas entomophila]